MFGLPVLYGWADCSCAAYIRRADQEYNLRQTNLVKKNERYSAVLARMCDEEAQPELKEVWRRGPDGCAVVFTSEAIMEALLKFQATGECS